MNTQPVAPRESQHGPDPVPRGWFQRSAISHPILLLLAVATPFVWITQMGSAVAGLDLMPAKLAELLLLVGLATAIARAADQRRGVRQLFAGLLRWRLGWRYLLLVAAMPLLTVGVALATGSLASPANGWFSVALTYLMFLAVGAVTANLWEETVWGGFVQGRLMARHGLLVGSLLTAVPVFLIHLPLAFEANGWSGTTWQDALITWGVLLVAAPFQRYLIGTLLIDTGGSTLAAGLIHASINAAGAMVVVTGGWQMRARPDPAHPRGRGLPPLAGALGDRRVRPGRHPGVRSRPAHRSRGIPVTTVVAGPEAGLVAPLPAGDDGSAAPRHATAGPLGAVLLEEDTDPAAGVQNREPGRRRQDDDGDGRLACGEEGAGRGPAQIGRDGPHHPRNPWR